MSWYVIEKNNWSLHWEESESFKFLHSTICSDHIFVKKMAVNYKNMRFSNLTYVNKNIFIRTKGLRLLTKHLFIYINNSFDVYKYKMCFLLNIGITHTRRREEGET